MIFTLICICNAIITNRISKAILIFYLAYYGVCLGISSINPYGLDEVTDTVYLIQFTGLIMFTGGFLLCGEMKGNNILITTPKIQFNLDKYKTAVAFLLVLILILIYYLTKYYSIIETLGGADARMERFTQGGLLANAKEILFFSYVVYPVLIFCMVIIAVSVINTNRLNLIFYLSLIYVSLYTLIGSGREMMFVLLIFIILVKRISAIIKVEKDDLAKDNNQNHNALKKRSKFILLSLLLVAPLFLMNYVTMTRRNEYDTTFESLQSGLTVLIKQAIIGFTGPFRAFEFALTNNYVGNTGLFFGRATFAGLDDIMANLLACVGVRYDSANSIVGNLLQNNIITIGSDVNFNFAYTHLMIFYFDFGLLGVVLFSFLFGYFVRKCINYFQNNPNFFSLSIVMFLFYAMLFSVFKWTLQSTGATLFLIIAYYFSMRQSSYAGQRQSLQ